MQKKSALEDFGLPKKTFGGNKKLPYARGSDDMLGLDKEPDTDDKTDGKPKSPPQSSGFVMDDMIAEMIFIPAETADYAGQTFFVIKDKHGQTPYAEKAGRFVPLYPSNTITQYIKWPSEAEDYKSDMILFERIMKFIEKWVDVDDSSRKLASLYVMFTWVYDAFDGVPYLRILADLGSGKAATLSSLVYTPDGPTRMGDIKVGQVVCNADGGATTVRAIHPQGIQDIYKITFSDGAEAEVTGSHLWYSWKTNPWRKTGYKERTTLEIKDMIERTKQRVIIPLAAPVFFNARPVPLDPYLVGALLGDGSLTKTNTIEITKPDDFILQKIKSVLPRGIEMSYKCDNTWCFVNDQNVEKKGGRKNGLIEELKELGILPVASEDRFVPEVYKQNSEEVRWSILQGLMDTDGTIGKAGGPSFTSKSERLAKDVQWLARSLGAKATLTTGYKVNTKTSVGGWYFNVHIRSNHDHKFFSLPRKQARCKPFNRGLGQVGRRVEAVQFVRREEAQCITVSDEKGLYIMDDFIVTHNSRFGIDVLGSIVYKPIRTMAATSMAALFRTIDSIKGTLILDEADLGDDSDKTSELVQVLNSGYKRGIPVLRCENAGRNDAMRAFQVFGPKIIISREHMKDHALESRCLPIRMRETTRKDLPYIVDRSLEKEAQVLRNMLLQWRLDRLPGAADRVDYSFAELPIAGRLKELLLLLSAAIVDEELKAMLRDYALSVNSENSERRGESLEGETVEIIQTIFRDQMKRNYLDTQMILATDICIMLNSDRDERKALTQRYVTSTILRERLAQKIIKGGGNKSFLSITITGVKLLCARYGIEDQFTTYSDSLKKDGAITAEEAVQDPEIKDALAGLIF